MMVRVDGEYLDFDGDIEIESRIKLFEDIETSNGDFSYSFDLSKTNKNLKALGFPFPDTIKSIYQNVRCELVDDSGFKIYTGSLQVNSITQVITCTFFGGNTDWFGQLSDPLNTLPLYKYDVELTEANIQASWSENTGIVFPILDAGTLVSRSSANLKIEDFTSLFYVKTLLQEIFNPLGIKLQGDLIEDQLFNTIAIAANGKSQDDVVARSSYVQKTTAQNNLTTTPVKVTYQNDSVFPFFDGSLDNFDLTLSRYDADVQLAIKIEVNFNVHYDSAPFTDAGFASYIYINGSPVFVRSTGRLNNVANTDGTFSMTYERIIQAGDFVEVYALAQGNGVTWGNTVDVLSGTLRITPFYIYKVFGKSSVPPWTKGEFVSNILRIFNVLPSFNPDSRTLTLDLFNKIAEKEPIDLSEEITIDSIDFSEFVSNYGKNNIFSYQEGSDEDLRQYNISNFISYGSGNLTVNNDFIENNVDVLESDFTSPITYLNGVFDMSMERINFIELEEVDEKTITSVTDSAGIARFNMSTASSLFSAGDLVRLETDVDTYNGEWVVATVTSTYITVNGFGHDVNATGTATLLRHKFTSDDNVYLMAVIPNVPNTFFTSKSPMLLEESTSFSTTSIAYFNILSNDRLINRVYKQSLSFGEVNSPFSYQRTILDTYWPVFSRVLNDPVMLKLTAYIKKVKYLALRTFLRPIRIKTNNTTNLYYLNKLTGYKSGDRPCNGEVIKL